MNTRPMTVADLPPDMQYDPDAARVVRDSGLGLRVDCRHGDIACPRCVIAAARRLVADADKVS